jgi:DNA polymerase-3 subunit alpha
VRFGLTAIKNVGEGAIASLLDVRKKQGRIASLAALCEDLDLRLVNKRVFESLIKAGAFDSLARGTAFASLPSAALRPRLLAAIDGACEYGARAQRDREQGQAQLFGGFDDHAAAGSISSRGLALPDAAPWTESEQLAFEKETLGLYWSGHPIDRYAGALREFGAKSIADLAEAQPTARDNTWGIGGPKPIEPDTSIGGIVAAVRPLKTKKGDRMAVFTLEDATGTVEIVCFPDAFSRANGLIDVGKLVIVRGKLERDDETSRILASEVLPIETVRERLAREVSIHLRKPADRPTLEALGEIFSRHRGDRKISFEIETGEAPHRLRVKVDVSSQIRVRPSPALIQDIEQVVGEGAVELR